VANYEFKLPDIGEGIAEGEIVSWKVAVGQEVKELDDFVEVMTDKATVTITVPHDGVIKELLYSEGSVVPVHDVIAVIEVAGGEETAEPAKSAGGTGKAAATVTAASRAPAAVQTASVAAPSTRAQPGRVLASPATRRRAREAGVALQSVPGTGKSGLVTNEDLENFLADGAASVVTPPILPPVSIAAPGKVSVAATGELEERIPFRGVRKKIAEAMSRSKFTATHFSVVEDLDVTELVRIRRSAKQQYAEQGINVTYMPFIMKAVVAGLRAYPWLNAALDESTQEVVLRKYYHLGIAADTDNGLIVPVIKDVDKKSIIAIASELGELAHRTREGKVQPDELKGSTFTISNAGNIGGLFATPIINFPEVAILGVHKIQKTPRVIDDEIVIRDVMYLSVSIDHRIVDGADGCRFLELIKKNLEEPSRLLLEI